MTVANWSELGLTAALVLITGFYAWATYKILRANRALVDVMHEQVEQQARPYVSVGIHQVPRNPILYLRITNTGRSPALRLRLTIDRDFYRYARQETRDNLATFSAFQNEIQSLASGDSLIFALAQGFEIFAERADPQVVPRVFVISATYSYGEKRVTEATTIDLNPYLNSHIVPDALVDELERVRKHVEALATQLRTLVSRFPNQE